MFLPDNQWWQYQYYLTFYKYSKFECIGNFLCNKSWSQIVEEFILDFVLMSVPSVIRKNLRILTKRQICIFMTNTCHYTYLQSYSIHHLSVDHWITFRWLTSIGFLTRLKETTLTQKTGFPHYDRDLWQCALI